MATTSSSKVTGVDSSKGGAAIYSHVSYTYYGPIHAIEGFPVTYAAPVVNTAYVVPIYVPKGRTINSVKVNCNATEAGDTFTGFVYGSTENGAIDLSNLLATGAGSTTANGGVRTDTLDNSILSDGDIFWVGIWTDASATWTIENYDVSVTGYLPLLGLDGGMDAMTMMTMILETYAQGTAPTGSGIVSAVKTDFFKIHVATS